MTDRAQSSCRIKCAEKFVLSDPASKTITILSKALIVPHAHHLNGSLTQIRIGLLIRILLLKKAIAIFRGLPKSTLEDRHKTCGPYRNRRDFLDGGDFDGESTRFDKYCAVHAFDLTVQEGSQSLDALRLLTQRQIGQTIR